MDSFVKENPITILGTLEFFWRNGTTEQQNRPSTVSFFLKQSHPKTAVRSFSPDQFACDSLPVVMKMKKESFGQVITKMLWACRL